MRALTKKSVKDVTRRKLRTILTILGIAVGVMGLTAINVASAQLAASIAYTNDASAQPDIAFVTSPADPALADTLAAQPNVKAIQAETRVVARWAVPTGHFSLAIAGLTDGAARRIGTFQMTEGTLPGPGEILLESGDRGVASVKRGDIITIQVGAATQRLTVSGFARTAGLPAPTTTQLAWGYMPQADLATLAGVSGANTFLVQLRDYGQRHETAKQLASVLEDRHVSVLAADVGRASDSGSQTIDGLFSVMRVLSIVALLLSIFLLLSTITTLVAEQVPVIGTLKAIGAVRGQVLRVYLTSVAIYGIAGTLIGLLAGFGLGELLFSLFASLFTLDPGPLAISPSLVITAAIVGIGVPLAAALLPILLGTRITVRQALSGYGLANGTGGAWAGAIGRIFAFVPQTVQLGMRGLFRKRTRATLTLLALAAAVPATQLPVLFLSFLGSVGFFGFLYVFPTGRFVPRWVLWIALVWTIQQVLHIFFAGSPADTSAWPLPIQLIIWSVFLGSVVYAQVFRYRHVSTPAQRLQTKWVVYGVTVAFLIYLITEAILIAIIRDLSQLTPGGLRASLAGSVVIYLGMLLIPLSIAIGILRYRLFDVDTLISRTLLYGALTLCVLGLYILIVGGFTLAFQEPGNPAIRLLATGVVAVAFQPLRERLQRGVNRLVYGRRDEPYAVLSQLARRLEATLAPAAVLPTVVETVAQALKLPYAAIALDQDSAFVTAASYGALAGEPLILPLVHQSETVGRLVLAPRGPGEGWTAADRRLLDDLAYQAGIAAHAVRLNDELQRARERLVLAREEERRRLRRDLHDGLGPQLASQTLTLTAAVKLLRQDPAAAAALLTEATTHAQQAIADIRRVVYDLRPPALDDLGLIAALREQVARYRSSGIQFEIAAPEHLPPLPAAVEVACYRIAQEALTNVVRHAGARHCALALTIDDKLRLEVRDDGRGIPPDRQAGVGLTSMRERAEELGGACIVAPAPDGGTRVFARLPLA